MGHHADHDTYAGRNVLLCLILFFGISVIGHYIFVAGAHHAPPASSSHQSGH